jgi:hypothetical protein
MKNDMRSRLGYTVHALQAKPEDGLAVTPEEAARQRGRDAARRDGSKLYVARDEAARDDARGAREAEAKRRGEVK